MGEIFDTMQKAIVLTRLWINNYNTVCPHSSLGYPAPQTVLQTVSTPEIK